MSEWGRVASRVVRDGQGSIVIGPFIALESWILFWNDEESLKDCKLRGEGNLKLYQADLSNLVENGLEGVRVEAKITQKHTPNLLQSEMFSGEGALLPQQLVLLGSLLLSSSAAHPVGADCHIKALRKPAL